MIRYEFKDQPLTIKNAKKANPQKIGEAITKAADTGGHIKPKAVVEAARNPRSPLHRHFEWDDVAAAEAYRLDQARSLIRSISVVEDDGDTNPAFLSVNEKTGRSYRTYEDVMNSADLQHAVLKQAEIDLGAFEKRYMELADVCEDIASARRKIANRLKAA